MEGQQAGKVEIPCTCGVKGVAGVARLSQCPSKVIDRAPPAAHELRNIDTFLVSHELDASPF